MSKPDAIRVLASGPAQPMTALFGIPFRKATYEALAIGPAQPMTEARRAEMELFLSPDYLRVALTDEALAITLAAQQGLILDDNFLEALKLNQVIGGRLEQLAIRQKENEYATRRK
jgi:hypothetical protein